MSKLFLFGLFAFLLNAAAMSFYVWDEKYYLMPINVVGCLIALVIMLRA